MHQGLAFISHATADDSIETIVRTALWRGELLPGAAAAIQRADQAGSLSSQDRRRLAILQDAIAHHHVRPIEL